ncbi:diacylglycerol O-acyltransferase 1 [Pichia californica]|uniref:Diacylglycerol O-acyltransferase n=1 Tax=Pichia californica TaxID=460514 RepID=A0A9P6WHV1_9ASCO|nr:diacylglycerol O-acyltransferase 1 [[Candida] californica]KAG0687415.1 diacylglycerol O-acyltransferase 1 [[Candida] californica]
MNQEVANNENSAESIGVGNNIDMKSTDTINNKITTNELDTKPNLNTHATNKIAPLNIPLIKRLQTLFILFHSTSIVLLFSLYFLLWCIPYLWPLMIYYTMMYYLLDRSPVNGGVWYRRSEKFRSSIIWKALVGYFPIKFHKITDLKPTFKYDPNNNNIEERIGPNYIFGYHPHGIIATGVSSGFTNNGTGWNEIFPGIKCFVTTLVNQFRVPFYRDYLMALGVTTVVKKNLKLLLNKGGSVVIVIGGARESLLAKPGLNSIVLNKRKGFVKLALESLDKNGLCLVPVYGFGENDVYNVFYTDDFSMVNNDVEEKEFDMENLDIQFKEKTKNIKQYILKFQLYLKNNFGWTLPIVISRGLFNYDFGIIPYRKPINVVFGKPISISRLNGLTFSDPVTQEEIDYWHAKYVTGLLEVWKWGKPRFANSYDEELKIVE